MAKRILNEEIFPIVGWAGPGGDMIRDDIIAGIAEAGFTISHSSPHPTEDAVRKALDIAHKNGVRLLLGPPCLPCGECQAHPASRKGDQKVC